MEMVENDVDNLSIVQLSHSCTMIDGNDDELHQFLKLKYTEEDIEDVERRFRYQNNGNNPVTVQEFEDFRGNLKGIGGLEKEKEQIKIRNLQLEAQIRRYEILLSTIKWMLFIAVFLTLGYVWYI